MPLPTRGLSGFTWTSTPALAAGETLEVELGWSVTHRSGGEALLQLRLEGPVPREVELSLPPQATHVWGRTVTPGFQQVRGACSLQYMADVRHLQIRREPGATARGVVHDAFGQPVRRGTIRGRREAPALGEIRGKVFSDGRFELHFDGAGPASLRVEGGEQGCAQFEGIELDASDPPHDLELTLQGSGWIEGVVRDPTGRPLTGVCIAAARPTHR